MQTDSIPVFRLMSKSRGCVQVAAMMFERRHSVSSKPGCDLLGFYGTGGMGKTTICKALCNHFLSEFQGRVCHLELGSEEPLVLLKRSLTALTGLRKDVVDQVHSESQVCIISFDRNQLCMLWSSKTLAERGMSSHIVLY